MILLEAERMGNMFGLSPIGVGRSETYPNTIQNRLSPSSMSAVGRVEPAQTSPVPPGTGVLGF